MSNFIDLIATYAFLRNALIVGLLIAVCSGLLGVSLVLKRYSMIGDGLSHVSFGTMAVAAALNFAPLRFSVIIVLIVAFLLLRISENSKIKGDAAIAMISSGFLALGILVTHIVSGQNSDLNDYMFGSIFSIKQNDLYLSIAISLAVLVIYVLFYNKIFAVTFDEGFSKATGVKVGVFNLLIALLTAATIVIGIKIMGALLISSLTIFPVVTSMRFFNKFKTVVVSSAVLSAVCFIIGFVATTLADLPLSACIVAANLVFFLLFALLSKIIKRNA